MDEDGPSLPDGGEAPDGTVGRGPYGVSVSGASAVVRAPVPALSSSSASRQRVRIRSRITRNDPKMNTYTTTTRPNMVHSVPDRVEVTASATRMFS